MAAVNEERNLEPVSKPRRSRRREEADEWETKGIRLLTSAATSFRKGFEIASLRSLISRHLSPDRSGILSEVHNGANNISLRLHFVEIAVGEIADQPPAVSPAMDRGNLGVLTQERQRRIEMVHEHSTPPFLEILVTIEGGLNVVVGLEEQDEVNHRRELRTRSLTASQEVKFSGCWRKCFIRRSSSARISRETGTSDGLASKSFHSSETKISFSEAVSCRTSGNCSRIIAGA
jgi:hypothetical protein